MEYGIDVVSLAREYGAKLEEYPLESLDRIATRIGNQAFVVLRSTACIRTKRFVLAHELAHLEDDTVDSFYTLVAEKRADKIAREKLIPEGDLKKAIDDYGPDYQILASLFGVPEEVMERRIKDIFRLAIMN